MDTGRALYLLAIFYVVALAVAGASTVVWLAVPSLLAAPSLARLWLTLASFSLLALLTSVLVLVPWAWLFTNQPPGRRRPTTVRR